VLRRNFEEYEITVPIAKVECQGHTYISCNATGSFFTGCGNRT